MTLDQQRGNTPTDEIEITPEMIEAGVLAFVEHDDFFEGKEDAVRRVFRAMIAAKRVAYRLAALDGAPEPGPRYRTGKL